MQIIRKDQGRNSSLRNLGAELEALKIEDLEVDEAHMAANAQEEIILLKKAVGDIDNVVAASTANSVVAAGGAADGSADMQKAQEQIASLKGLLKEAQTTIKTMKAEGNGAPVSATAASAEMDKAMAVQSDEIAKLKATIADKDSTIAKMSTQTSGLQDELKLLAAAGAGALAADSAAKEKVKEAEARVAELEAELEKKSAEMEKKLEEAQEEMMEAMAQEVEEVEKQSKADAEKSEAEKAEMSQQIEELRTQKDELQTQLEASTASSGNIAKQLSQVQEALFAVKDSQKSIVAGMNADVAEVMASMKGTLSSALSSKMQGMMTEFQNLVGRYRKEVAERKKLHNMVQELKGNIRVYMRARPPSTKELDQFGPDSNCVTFLSNQDVKVLSEKGREKTWEFDRVFDLKTTQEDVYKEVSPLVTSAIDGYAVCIFAYGQTGSGKTYTMNGPPDSRGVNTRALAELFGLTAERSKEGWEDVITVSVLEVYNEEIHDLLSDEGGALQIRQSAEGNYVPGLTSVEVMSLVDVDKLMQIAEKHRSQQATNMNEHSSRSHMMLSITIASHNKLTGYDSKGKLHLVDLAGSERLNKTGAEGKALKEAQNINKSLSALGDVIQARANKQGHVPFRNSTLTYLLQDALSQDSKTLMFVCASPVIYNAEETYCSLNFAARARTVELGTAKKNTGKKK